MCICRVPIRLGTSHFHIIAQTNDVFYQPYPDTKSRKIDFSPRSPNGRQRCGKGGQATRGAVLTSRMSGVSLRG